MVLAWRLVGVLALVLIGAGSSLQLQLHSETLNQLAQAAAAGQQAEQDRRLALDQQLSAAKQTHWRKLSDTQDGLRGCFAVADRRLSAVIKADLLSSCWEAKGLAVGDHVTI